MRKLMLVAAMASLPMVAQADMSELKAEAKKITGAFFQDLKGELVKGMQAGGPVAALGVCKAVAPAVADKHSQQSGWEVGRTSFKLRNPDNAPDAWETGVLEQFAQRRAQGEGPDTLAYAEIVEEDGKSYFRFMKGIVMPPMEKLPCLACHGEKLAPEVAAEIDKLYPDDQARGYKAGQVRGAFTLKKPL